ncbi:VOC family protein [Fulvimarina endophytica]|uniref:VOC family protein n=1 Tax=Fulvimarina endophytica TaxID=2293836 RepID=A0A371X4R5_9HYPH|nr:VOC family protein [Fulvimarina endophytica]RFC64210.1 VOC family protein [Fulvimarina endophytica]
MRALDHIVMPFAALGEARGFLESLGFTVAPEARHPFGTGNACVFFSSGPFLEPLARLDEAACTAADREGNLFVRRDAAFRDRPVSAFSALALASPDIHADRESLALLGLAEQASVDFSRVLTLGDGTTADLSFSLAFAKDFSPRAPSLFLCEQRGGAGVDRGALTRHENGASAIAGVEFATTDLDAAEAYLTGVLGAEGEEDEDGDLRFATPAGFVSVVEVGGAEVPSFALGALIVETSDLDAVRRLFEARSIDFEDEDDSLAVACPNGPGRLVFV